MLRLGTIDIAGEDPAALALSPALITRALGDLVSERLGSGAGFAIEQLCASLLDEAPRAAQRSVDRLIACGVSIDAIYDTYIPRAAARLGEMWVDDAIAFTGVTLGMARLTEVFRRLSPMFLKDRTTTAWTRPLGGQALFALGPGENHCLGVAMAADYFQRAGWSVRVELRAGRDDLERIVRERPFDLIGLSSGSRRMIPDLRRTVARLRAAARPSTRFLLGGPLVTLEDAVAGKVGVDIAASAAQDALSALGSAARHAGGLNPGHDRQPFPA